MDENAFLGDVVQSALNDWLAANGGGFPTSFVIAVDYVNNDGESSLIITDMPGQKTRHSLGLIGELDEYYRFESRVGWASTFGEDDE